MIQRLAEQLGQVARVGSKPHLMADLPIGALMSLAWVADAASSNDGYDRAVALVDQIRWGIDQLGAGNQMSEAAHVLFGLDLDSRDLNLQDRRDRAAEIVGSRGGWDSFRRGPEKRILHDLAEQLYRLERSKRDGPDAESHVVIDLPALFHAADASSVAGQRHFLRATKLRLIMLVVGAATGGIGWITGQPLPATMLVAAVAFVAALAADMFILQAQPDQLWFKGRAAAESVKSLAWRYAVGGEPFGLASIGSMEADQLLIKRLSDSLRDLDGLDLSHMPADGEQITATMRALRVSTLAVRKRAYETQRIDDQRSWYAARAALSGLRARRWSTAIVTAEAAGAVAAIVKAAGDVPFGMAWLLALCGASAAAAAAWSQTRQHQAMTTSYSVAANELTSIRALITWHETEESWAEFVSDAERAISREHSLWRVSRGVRVSQPSR